MEADFTMKLLQWNRESNNRKMPWKGEKDPYKIWLSEIILQQTRVEQGRAYYERFIKRFPDVHKLARASENSVFKLWEGLGYYTRCRNLMATARYISKERNGVFPDNYEAISALKGIGPYTAAAIASFAFDEPRAVVDGNVQRVLARYFGITTPTDESAGKKLFNELAQALISTKEPAAYNQAIMDFGATICKPRAPLCQECIQRQECIAFRTGTVEALPAKTRAPARKARWFYYFVIRVNGQYYVNKRTQKDIWQNLYEFLLYEAPGELTPGQIRAKAREITGGRSFTHYHVSVPQRQVLSHQQLTGQFVHLQVNEPVQLPETGKLVTEKQLAKLPFPRFIAQYLEKESWK